MWRSTTISQSSNRAVASLDLLRMLLIETPLAILIGCVAFSWGIHRFYYDYYEIYMASLLWTDVKQATETTYYRRVCTEDDFSADSLDDMVISPNETATEAADKLLYHGSIIFPKLVSTESAQELREHILERNRKLTKDDVEFIWLISNPNRWSYKVDIDDHPSVAKVMNEVASHTQFRETLEDMFGTHPALVELTAITSAYGAGDQHFHKDNTADQTTQFYARSFADMYSVFIPLQDTTAEMGATDACPGLHICHNDDDLCNEDTAMRISNDDRLWETGDAWIFQMSVDHRGPAHTAEGAPDRVILILTFTARPNMLEHDFRIPSLETSYSLKMEMSGLTLTDFLHKPPSSLWKALAFLGIYGSRGWDYIHFSAQRIINVQFGFREADLRAHLARMNKSRAGTLIGRFADVLRRELFGGEMPEEHDDDPIWKVYVEACIARMQSRSRQACLLAAIVYATTILVTILSPGQSGRRLHRLFWSVFRICLFSSPLLATVFLGLHRLDQSQWGQDIRRGRIFERPFLSPNIPSAWQVPAHIGPTVFPSAYDVLIPTRLDAPGLAAKNRFLEISHPGNIRWKNILDQHSSAFLTTPPFVQEAIITLIHNKVFKKTEFLLQNHEGFWVVLSDLEARKYTRRKLLEYDPLIRILAQTTRELGSELRHGRNRHTAMSRFHLPVLLNRLQQTIYSEEDSTLPKLKSQATKEKAPFPLWKITTLNQRHPSVEEPKRVFGTYSRGGLTRLGWSVDDFVIAFDGSYWLEGNIQKVVQQSQYFFYDVKLVNGVHLDGASEKFVRFFHEDMLVEGAIEANEGRLSRIAYVTADGDYETTKFRG